MDRSELKALLEKRSLLFDGAMGTLLHSKGITIDHCFDVINVSQPAVVADIHRAYIEAGVNVIEANSFGANRYKLAEYGLQNQVGEINKAAVTIARRTIDSAYKEVLLAGSIGPLGVRLAPLGRVSKAEAKAAFMEQIGALVGEDRQAVDLLVIETLSDPLEMEMAVSAARAIAPDLPIVAQMCFNRDDRTLLGFTPDQIATKLASLDVDAIGINCSGGPAQVLRLIMVMRELTPNLPLAASPNAGWPEQTESGRMHYSATPDYFGKYAQALLAAGVQMVGGCCGTTDTHIAAMRHAIDNGTPVEIELPRIEIVEHETVQTAVIDPPTKLANYIDSGTFVVTVEMSPPKGIAPQRLIEGAKMLKNAGANILNIADAPLARMRMSAWAASHLVQQEVGLETILHFPTRGRNLLRIQGDLLAAYAMGIRNLFVTMGDPTKIGDYPEAMDSYDIVPTGLIDLIKHQFNEGRDKSGQSIDQATRFVVGCALSLTPKDPERELKLLRKKIRNGADFALTQPIFNSKSALQFIKRYEAEYDEPMLPLLAGVKPLYNSRNAEFLHNEVPGIIIPEEQRKRMATAVDPQQEGVLIAQEILAEIRPFVQGIYLMPAFGRYDLVADVIDAIREETA